MTTIAEEGRPCNSTIVAFTTEFTFDDLDHVDFIGPRPHFKDGGMTDLAFKSDSMKPVREYDGRHAGFFRLPVEGDIAVLSFGYGRKVEEDQKPTDEGNEDQTLNDKTP